MIADVVGLRALAICFLMINGVLTSGVNAKTGKTSETNNLLLSEWDRFNQFDEFENEFEQGEELKLPASQVFDPLYGYNYRMFYVNEWMYVWITRPTARFYARIVPKDIRIPIGRFLNNIQIPVSVVNAMLQLEFKKAGKEFGRFQVNSTVGLFGLFDPAAKYLKWYPAKEDFGLTLGHYGVGEGCPLVLPLIGTSNLRDSIALIPQLLFNPITYIEDFNLSVGFRAATMFNTLSLEHEMLDKLKDEALDPYTFFRDMYRQNREKRIQE